MAEEIARSLASHAFDALGAKAKHLAALRLGGHADLRRAVERRNGDLAAERGGADRDRHLAVQVVVIAGEDRVRLDVHLDVEIAGRAAVDARLAFAGEAHAVALVDARRNFDRQGFLQLDAAAARALCAGVRDDAARAVAARARLRDGEGALRDTHLACAAAGGAGRGLCAGTRSAALADVAGRHRRDANFRFKTVRGLLERDLEVVAQVRAAEDRRAAAACAAEDLPEDVAEDVAEAAHAGASGARRVRIDARVAELVVRGALLRIAEHFVGFLRLLEVLLGARVFRIAVRMPFHGEPAIGLLQVFFGGVAVDAEHFVVIALRHASFPTNERAPLRARYVTSHGGGDLSPPSCL